MNAQARHSESPARVSGRAEHISLEASGDAGTAPVRQPHRPTLASYTLRSALRGSCTELRILQDHYLAVHCQRPGAPAKKFTFDLRFANPRPVVVRKVAWLCLGTFILLSLATIGALAWALSVRTGWQHPGFIGGAVGLAATLAMGWLFLRRTSESLRFTSVHGGAVLIDLLGGIGAAKQGKTFIVDLIKNISAAKQAREQSPAQFLRDEMREHHRLRELNVLTQAEYDASKARILAAHS